jgi:putative endonuclease
MSMFRKNQGAIGEDYAVSYLKKLGFQLIERNFRIRGGEVDIVAIETSKLTAQKTLVFVEVKTRSSSDFGTPLEAINYYKLKSLMKTAQFYKVKHPRLPELMRIDAVSVVLGTNNELLEIELVKNIS